MAKSMDKGSISTFLTISENRSRILAVIVSMVRDFEVAEDLFQETVIEILKNEERFDPTRNFVPWACGIARNIVLQHWRRQAQAPSNGLSEMIGELALIAADGDDDTWRRERTALRRCFQRLPDRMQKLLLLRYGHNVKGKALADSAAFRQGSIRTTLSRLRAQLRVCIDSNEAQRIQEVNA
ncbi:sigma-70 family RNA polymerase sigma factor [Rhodopirellula sp. SWK7]|uniref:sigma-70 family RNA polymerase sigma factor n=1 Tax=Rhodopirellula sp. SWK7 TaxID=595460 RepID=UPI0002BE3E1A|nr:sigma-70 family RNA polymerase sigma factor [Rhodopirellula sp. SWK7]EMI45681.1 RNA polymerase sigma-70 domain protein [Rhodopirellula sp. SWK7]